MAVEQFKITGEYKVCVAKALLPHFLDACKAYAPVVPTIITEVDRGEKGQFWVVEFCAGGIVKQEEADPAKEQANDILEEAKKVARKLKGQRSKAPVIDEVLETNNE